MPAQLSYPGVYIEELPSGVRTITGVATAITAFVGQALRGSVDDPVRVQSFAEFERTFGGLSTSSTLGYAVMQFFQNGGGDALIVRVTAPGNAASATVDSLQLIATTGGAQANAWTAAVSNATSGTASLFKLTIVNAPAPPVIFDEVIFGNVATVLAGSIVQLDPAAPPLSARPVNTAAVTFTGGVNGAAPATLASLGTNFVLAAANAGDWGEKLKVTVTNLGSTAVTPLAGAFNLSITDTATSTTEQFLNLSLDQNSARFVTRVLEQGSDLVRIGSPIVSTSKIPTPSPAAAFLVGGDDGVFIADADLQGSQVGKTGLFALEKADLFNLLCIPPLMDASGMLDIGSGTRTAAATYCAARRALYIVDPLLAWRGPGTVLTSGAIDPTFGMAHTSYAALFFPLLRGPDPLRDGQIGDFAPCGAVAGVMARTDATRGVWKAPAGTDATLNGAVDLTVKLTDGENGQLNPVAVNCLRSFPVIGRVVWGARTLNGADQLADQWKYIPVRRLALFLEESLFRGTQWVVFEPNDEPLWAQIRLNIGAFLHNLFRQGAFQGISPKDAYFVKCDKDTTTQNDIDQGVVNIVVGFAPLKPAEFVVIKIQQIAGTIET